ncbi:hypothetical protein KI387_040693, partial [Taxus chinensis]
ASGIIKDILPPFKKEAANLDPLKGKSPQLSITGPTSGVMEELSAATSKTGTHVSRLTHMAKKLLEKTMQDAPVIVVTPLQAVPHPTSRQKATETKETTQDNVPNSSSKG